MASPQLENGYLRIANEIILHLVKTSLLGAEFQILIFIIIKTYGYNKKKDWISITQFEKGTELSRPTIVKALKNLIIKNIIIKSEKYEFSFNKDWEKWSVNPPLLVKCSNRSSKPAFTKIGKPALTHKRHNTITKDNTFLLKLTKEEQIMYNYENIDENGNPIKKKKIGAISKEENKFLISIGFMWKDMVSEYLKIPKEDIILLNIYYPLRSVYDKEKWGKEEFKELFIFFLKDKIPDESKISFDLCLSQKYIAKFKLKKQLKLRPKTLSQISDEIKL